MSNGKSRVMATLSLGALSFPQRYHTNLQAFSHQVEIFSLKEMASVDVASTAKSHLETSPIFFGDKVEI